MPRGNFVVLLVIIGVVSVAAYFFLHEREAIAPTELSFGATYVGAPLTGEYRNAAYRFSLMMPDGFEARELPAEEGVQTIVLQGQSGDGIQITIAPYGQDALRIDDIRAELPDLVIDDVQSVEIGESVDAGVAFTSDNPAFAGKSREVWFVFKGNLYQISTYARLDGLLQAMFATWTFF